MKKRGRWMKRGKRIVILFLIDILFMQSCVPFGVVWAAEEPESGLIQIETEIQDIGAEEEIKTEIGTKEQDTGVEEGIKTEIETKEQGVGAEEGIKTKIETEEQEIGAEEGTKTEIEAEAEPAITAGSTEISKQEEEMQAEETGELVNAAEAVETLEERMEEAGEPEDLAPTVYGNNDLIYLDYNMEQKEMESRSIQGNGYILIDANNVPTEWNAGWYAVTGSVMIPERVTVKGDVHLILTDGCELDAQKGITVSGSGNSISIYAQSAGDNMGKLIAHGEDRAAGIGGMVDSDGNNITINGGDVIATAEGGAAGIGGGASDAYMSDPTTMFNRGNGYNIMINGGKVTAHSSITGAGIGGGILGVGSDITVNGGKVTAYSVMGAGIGGGMNGNGKDITITGGDVMAKGGADSPGIGGGTGTLGYGGIGTDIVISGGNVKTTRIGNGGDVGVGPDVPFPNITISSGVVWWEDWWESEAILSKNITTDCIIFMGTEGMVYGNAILENDLTVGSDYTLTIPYGASLGGQGLLKGEGRFITENLTEDMILMPGDFTYNGEDQTSSVLDAIKINTTNHRIQGAAFCFDESGWTKTISPIPVLEAGEYFVICEKNGIVVLKSFRVIKPESTEAPKGTDVPENTKPAEKTDSRDNGDRDGNERYLPVVSTLQSQVMESENVIADIEGFSDHDQIRQQRKEYADDSSLLQSRSDSGQNTDISEQKQNELMEEKEYADDSREQKEAEYTDQIEQENTTNTIEIQGDSQMKGIPFVIIASVLIMFFIILFVFKKRGRQKAEE